MDFPRRPRSARVRNTNPRPIVPPRPPVSPPLTESAANILQFSAESSEAFNAATTIEGIVLKERVSNVYHSLSTREIDPVEAYRRLSVLDSQSESILAFYLQFQLWVAYGEDLSDACKSLASSDDISGVISYLKGTREPDEYVSADCLRQIFVLVKVESPLLDLLGRQEVSIPQLTEEILNLDF